MTEINELLNKLRNFQENQDYAIIDKGREKTYLIYSKELAKSLRRVLISEPYLSIEGEISRMEASCDGSCYVYRGDASALSDGLTITQSSTRITTETSSSPRFVNERFSNENENIFQTQPVRIGGWDRMEKAFQEDWEKLQKKATKSRGQQECFQPEAGSARIMGELKTEEEERRWLAGEDSDTEIQEVEELERKAIEARQALEEKKKRKEQGQMTSAQSQLPQQNREYLNTAYKGNNIFSFMISVLTLMGVLL